MKTINILSAALLTISVGAASADVEFSSLVQWEESQKPTAVSSTPLTPEQMVENINRMEATAAGQEQHSSLIQWEESQYAVPYAFSIDDINKMEATAAGMGQNELSGLIQWEGSANEM